MSPSETHSSASPPSEPGVCYECSVYKGKLAVSENRCRYLEGRTATLQVADEQPVQAVQLSKCLQTDALRFSTRVSVSENNARQFEQETRIVREQNEMLQVMLQHVRAVQLVIVMLQRKLLECQEKTLAFMQAQEQTSPALSAFLNDVLQTTFFR